MKDGFVGRAVELATLAECLDEASAGAPRVVLLRGDAGAGKSTLVREFLQSTGSTRVIWATADPEESRLPFGVVDQLARQLQTTSGTDARILDRTRREPFLEGVTLLRWLDEAQIDGVVVLVIDDVQHADAQSSAALAFSLRRLHSDRVLTVMTTRPDEEVQIAAGLLRLIAARGVEITLGGLTTTEVMAMCAAVGLTPVTPRAAERLRLHTDGHPLYLRALMAELTFDDIANLAQPLPVPHSFARLVVADLRQMTQQAQLVAAAAAVIGGAMPVAVLGTTARVDGLLSAVDELQASEHFVVKGSGTELTLEFSHPLARAAVYEDLTPSMRVSLHERAAETTEGSQALWHRVAASTAADPALVAALEALADVSRSSGAHRAAADALLAAAKLRSPGPQRDQLFVDAVEVMLLDGDVSLARTYVDELERLPATAHRLQAQARIAWLSGDHDRAERLATAAWDQADELRPRTVDGLAAMLAQISIGRGDGQGAATWADRALSSGLLAGDVAATTRATGAIGFALTGRAEAGFSLLPDRALEPDSVEPERRPELRARGMLRLWTDDLEGARSDLQASRPSDGDRRGFEPYRLVALGYFAETEYRRGDWDGAAALADQAISLVDDTGQTWALAFVHAMAAFVPAARGQWDDANHHVSAAREAAASLGDQVSRAYAANAVVHLAACRGDPAGVLTAAEWLFAGGRGGGHEPGFLGWSVHHLDALVALGRLDEAERVLNLLDPVARLRQRRSRLAALARVRAELAAARHETGDARKAFEAAIDIGQGATDALEGALVHFHYGRFLRRRGERKSAVAHLQAAHQRLADLGAQPYVERCEQELAAAGHARHPRSDGETHTLTPQEIAVTRLVCEGRTNREAASELFVSVKTISYHLGNVYSKLGVRSRTELANHFATRSAR